MLKQKMTWIRCAVTVVAGVAALLTTVPRVEAQEIAPGTPDKVAFGLVGITRGQSARINVVIGNPDFIGNPDLRPVSCHVMLSFVDETGAPFLDRAGNRIAVDGSVRPGQSLSLDLHSFDVFRMGGSSRRQIRAVAWGETVPGTPDSPSTACMLPAALTEEIYELSSGRTSVLYPLAPGFLPAVH